MQKGARGHTGDEVSWQELVIHYQVPALFLRMRIALAIRPSLHWMRRGRVLPMK